MPCCITRCFGEDIDLLPGDNNQSNRLFVTLGQFSIIRLERDIQLLMPAYDVCMPEKDCSSAGSDAEDPCDAFDRFAFPFDEFFPAGGDRRPPHHCGCEGGSNSCTPCNPCNPCNPGGSGGNSGNNQNNSCCKRCC
ncbi:hypothetical protein D7X33_10325 [Butyricicoccus sp. 1XD8-22]|nr:hypothetical protein D7X33_10325 [Butyricicoccus sp. 1XD8-22]